MNLFKSSEKEKELKAGIYFTHTSEGTVQDGLVDRIIDLSKKIDIFLGPEYLLRPLGGCYSIGEKNQILDRIANKTKGSLVIPGTILWHDDSTLHNTCPVIYDGNVHEYNKYNQDLAMQSTARKFNLRVGSGSGQKIHEWNDLNYSPLKWRGFTTN